MAAALLAATPLSLSTGPLEIARAGGDSPPAPVEFGADTIGVLAAPGEEVDHVAIVWDEVIDPGSSPAPTDFEVAIEGVPVNPLELTVTLVYSGFTSDDFVFGIDGASFMTIDLPANTTWTAGEDSVVLSYTPDANPIRDLALNPAEEIRNQPVVPWDFVNFSVLGTVVDSHHADDRILVGLSLPIEAGSIPDPGHFVVEVDGSRVDVQTVTQLHPDRGMGVLDLELANPVDRSSDVTLDYLPDGDPVLSARDGTALESFENRPVVLMLASDAASAMGSASTATPDGPSPADPIATTVISPSGGLVTIEEASVSGPPAAGYEFLGQQVEITAPEAEDADHPLVLRFDTDASLVPAGHDHTTIQIFRDGVLVPECIDPGVVEPSPCVSERAPLANRDISITVLTLLASLWSQAVVEAPSPVVFYLHNSPTPPTGWTNAQAILPMNPAAPTATTLTNYAANLDGNDGVTGRFIDKTTRGLNERDRQKVQAWRTAASVSDLVINADLQLHLWAKMKAPGKNVRLRAFLSECTTATSCTHFATLDMPTSTDALHAGFQRHALSAAGVSHTIEAGNRLELRVVMLAVPDSDPAYLGYDTLGHASRLVILPGGD